MNSQCLKIIGSDIKPTNRALVSRFCNQVKSSNIDLENIDINSSDLKLLTIQMHGSISFDGHRVDLDGGSRRLLGDQLTADLILKLSNNKPLDVLLLSCHSSERVEYLAEKLNDDIVVITSGMGAIPSFIAEEIEASMLEGYFFESNNIAQNFLEALPYLAGARGKFVTKNAIFDSFDLSKKWDLKKETIKNAILNLNAAKITLNQLQEKFINFVADNPKLSQRYDALTPVEYNNGEILIFSQQLFMTLYKDLASYSIYDFDNIDADFLKELCSLDYSDRVIFDTAIRRGDIKMLKTIVDLKRPTIELTISNINKHAIQNIPHLHIAARSKNIDIIKLILDFGADTNRKDEYNKSALEGAIEDKSWDVARLLLDHNAEILNLEGFAHVYNEIFVRGQFPNFNYIIFEIAKELILKYDFSHGLDFGYETPFSSCRESAKEYKILHLMLSGTNERTNILSEYSKELLSIVFSKVDPNIEFKDQRGDTDTFIHWTIQNDHTDLLEILLDRKDDLNIMRPNTSQTGLQAACQYGNYNIVKLLVERGVNIDEISDDADGWQAIHSASYQGHTEIVKYLLENNADINAKTKGAESSLSLAIEHGKTETALLLISNNADIYQKGLLKLASDKYYPRVEILKTLLNLGVKPNAGELDEILSYTDSIEVAELLINASINQHMVNHKAILNAIEHNNINLLNLFLKHTNQDNIASINLYEYDRELGWVSISDSILMQASKANFEIFTKIIDCEFNFSDTIKNKIFWNLALYRSSTGLDLEKFQYYLTQNISIKNDHNYDTYLDHLKINVEKYGEHYQQIKDIMIGYCSQTDSNTGEIRECFDLLTRNQLIGEDISSVNIES